jgi:YidC/Oxa1 family membrane protein insertase
MSFLFNTFLYQPLMNALIVIYQLVPGQDFGIAVILLTIIIRFLLYPVSAKGVRAQKAINEIQPRIKEIQEKHKKDKEKQVKEILEVYKEAKVSPFSAFLPLLIQLPVLIALYRVLWGVQTTEAMKALYSFVPAPQEISSMFLGSIELAQAGIVQEINGASVFLFGNLVIIIGAVVAQFVQMKMISAKNKKVSSDKKQGTQEMAERMQKQMLYFFPFFTFFILLKMPLAIGLYWLVSTLFSIAQQHIILKKT